VQKELTDLRSIYFSKKKSLSSKVHNHLDKIEEVFQIYYETLDDLRNKLLKEEYEYIEKMDSLENRLKKMVGNLKNFSVMEFYHEEEELNHQMKTFRLDLESFNIYLPGS
jgi:excinuclease UvrABC helicase subunit UvrB